jgi:hypothetical protein
MTEQDEAIVARLFGEEAPVTPEIEAFDWRVTARVQAHFSDGSMYEWFNIPAEFDGVFWRLADVAMDASRTLIFRHAITFWMSHEIAPHYTGKHGWMRVKHPDGPETHVPAGTTMTLADLRMRVVEE